MPNKHNDGPWHIDQHPYDDSSYGLFDDYGTQLGSIERWDGDNEADVMEAATANARLIAAAPTLLDTLEKAQAALDAISDVCLFEDGKPQTALEAREVDEIFNLSRQHLAEIETLVKQAKGE